MHAPILVTGAAGFAGSHLLDLLSQEHVSTVAWHRPGGAQPGPRASVEWQAVDLLNRRSVVDSVARVRPRAVYHCAGAAHVGRAWGSTEPTFAANVKGTHYLLEALDKSGVDARVLIPSSAMVYASSTTPLREDDPLGPSSPYALSKLAQELVAGTYPGERAPSIARAFNHFGPRQNPLFVASDFARQIADIEAGRRNPEITVGNLDAQRDFTDVRDTVRAYRMILEHGSPGRVYNVCSGHAVSIQTLLDQMLAKARVPIQVKVDPARYRPNDSPILVGDPGRLRDELGWTPTFSREQTLDDLLDYWRSA
jgi:GDP-4-dehydro-6-deoxy-D-mannose reductase